MAKSIAKALSRRATPSAKKFGYNRLLTAIESASRQMVGRVAVAVNQALVIRNWLVGDYIVEYEQGGADRAQYGARLLERLAIDLAERGNKGLGLSMLKNCRQFYLLYPQIRQPLVTEFTDGRIPTSKANDIRQPVVGESADTSVRQFLPNSVTTGYEIRGTLTPELGQAARCSSAVRKPTSAMPTPLSGETVLMFSWTHLLELIRITDPWKRAFYENECLKGNWSKRQLQRQIESLLYERTGLSKNKAAVIRRAQGQEPKETIEDMIRDPYVLEFTGLAERAEYSENDLETALLDHLQRFLLELGTGFCFEARQFRITLNNKHNHVDMVFYHRRLRCHVLLDLKIRAFRHADAGQMNFYLNWFKANLMTEGNNPPVGIILCSDKHHTEVEFATAGMDNQFFVSRYLTALPSAEQLKAWVERDRARMELPAAKSKNK